MNQKRILLDTNIYGLIIADKDIEEVNELFGLRTPRLIGYEEFKRWLV